MMDSSPTRSGFDARRQWPEASTEDFEHVDKRLWRDRATGIEYRQAKGNPLLSVGTQAVRDISMFIVAGGKLIFLEPNDLPEGTIVHHGPVLALEIPEPGRPAGGQNPLSALAAASSSRT